MKGALILKYPKSKLSLSNLLIKNDTVIFDNFINTEYIEKTFNSKFLANTIFINKCSNRFFEIIVTKNNFPKLRNIYISANICNPVYISVNYGNQCINTPYYYVKINSIDNNYNMGFNVNDIDNISNSTYDNEYKKYINEPMIIN